MYVPIWWWASGTIWKGEEHGHAPLVLAVIVWLFWRIREPLVASTAEGGSRWGAPIFAFGLLLYTAGRAFQVSILEFASQPFVALGVLLLIGGRGAPVRRGSRSSTSRSWCRCPGPLGGQPDRPAQAMDLRDRRSSSCTTSAIRSPATA
jgi:hypothetical protein